MTDAALLPSEARTATATTAEVRTTVGDRGALLILDITDAPNAEETLYLTIEAKDEVSGEHIALSEFNETADGSALGEGGRYAYILYPTPTPETMADGVQHLGLPAPRHWRATVTHSGSGSWTYSLGYQPLS